MMKSLEVLLGPIGKRVQNDIIYCFVPEGVIGYDKEIEDVRNIIQKQYKELVTHYSVEWVNNNKVNVKLYTNDCFGAGWPKELDKIKVKID